MKLHEKKRKPQEKKDYKGNIKKKVAGIIPNEIECTFTYLKNSTAIGLIRF